MAVTMHSNTGGGIGKPKWAKNTNPVTVTGAVAAALPATPAGKNLNIGGSSEAPISSGGSGGGSSSSSAHLDFGGGGDNYFDATSVYMEYLNQLKAQAQAAYDRNMQRISDTYNTSRDALQSNYNSTRGQLENSMNRSRNEINTDSEAAMRQAFVNNMLSRRDLAQSMAAQGMSGGASETTRASLENNYGNARNQIDTQRGKSLSDLNETYNNNIAAALQQYNSQMANLDMQRMQLEQQVENALTNFQSGYAANFSMLAPSNDAYLNALAALRNNQAGFTFQGALANNPYQAVSMQQAQNGGNTNYAEYIAQQALLNGGSPAGAKASLYNAYRNGNISQEDLVSMMNRLGL